MTEYIDLHMHTDYSDGLASPEELLALVRQSDITAFSVTDHDTLDGYRAVKELLRNGTPELIPGVELSVRHEKADIHILAYLFDPDNAELNAALGEFQKRRNDRARLMVEKLNGFKLEITFAEVKEASGHGVIGRPHVAGVLFENDQVPTYQSAFDKYIGNGKPAYVPKENFTPSEAIKAIHAAGGLAILAHPQIDETYRYLEMLVGLGLDGIEAYHSAHTQQSIDRFKHLAERYRLAVSGGSDFHGRMERHGAIGSQHVPATYLAALKQRAKARKDRQ